MRILVVTNRNLRKKKKDEHLFGEKVNRNGATELRLAWAKKNNGKWRVKLIPEPNVLDMDSLPSRTAYREYRDGLEAACKNCVFYAHGYNKSFEESLDQAHKIQRLYGTGVLLFSWPSNPGGFILHEYDEAQAIARISAPALDRVFGRLSLYLREERLDKCSISFNMIVHSMGAYLFQNFVEHPIFSGQTRMFDNIILHQSDVDHKKHELWVDQLRFSRRRYITMNERDFVLDASDIINSDRLGNTAEGFSSSKSIYVDFTGGKEVDKDHQLFGETAMNSNIVKDFFDKACNGEAAHGSNGVVFNIDRGCYEVS